MIFLIRFLCLDTITRPNAIIANPELADAIMTIIMVEIPSEEYSVLVDDATNGDGGIETVTEEVNDLVGSRTVVLVITVLKPFTKEI